MSIRPGVSYILPLKWSEPGPIEEIVSYLRGLEGEFDEALVIDGSPPAVFDRHARALDGVARHLAPHRDLVFEMGKVNGVLTGVRESGFDSLLIADDDVRYTPATLRRTVGLLEQADLIRPQNYFDELPWHARWDTARTLLNRVFTGDVVFPAGDFPGTLAVRRSSFVASGAYDGDAMFENLELMRTVHAAGGSILTPLDLFVARRPPSSAHFFSQRVRQAYDDFAIPARLTGFLAIGPCILGLAHRGRYRTIGAIALASIALAEIGRRRAGGTEHFPIGGSLLAPLWIAERSVTSWLALAARLRGGVPYGERRLSHSATSVRELRRRYSERSSAESPTETPLSA